MTDFADQLAALNEWHFFKEFVYSKNVFKAAPEREVELADSLIWLGSSLIAFQLKERIAPADANLETEARWFEKKVLGKATKQVRDTLAYLGSMPLIDLQNHRGHTLGLDFKSLSEVHKVVAYLPGNVLPEAFSRTRYHRSKTAGVIHVVSATDYLGVVRTLLTPPELCEYLAFRKELIDKWDEAVQDVPEAALLGHYLCGDADSRPSVDFLRYVEGLDHRTDEWDMSGVIARFPDRITTGGDATDYYPIVIEIAQLKRNELREFKSRFMKSMEKARADEFVRPYRMESPRTKCGFVFIPLTREMKPHRTTALKNFTGAHKYDRRLDKCVGVSIAPEAGNEISAEWCYIESEWELDPEIDRMLKENSPFREVREAELPRYTYRRE